MDIPYLSDVTPETLPKFESALRGLATDLIDPFRIRTNTLDKALFGQKPVGYGAISQSGTRELIGAALYSPLISTAIGHPGAYVSDLWVAELARGQKVGRTLLRYVARRSDQMWDARFLRLTVYDANKPASSGDNFELFGI